MSRESSVPCTSRRVQASPLCPSLSMRGSGTSPFIPSRTEMTFFFTSNGVQHDAIRTSTSNLNNHRVTRGLAFLDLASRSFASAALDSTAHQLFEVTLGNQDTRGLRTNYGLFARTRVSRSKVFQLFRTPAARRTSSCPLPISFFTFSGCRYSKMEKSWLE